MTDELRMHRDAVSRFVEGSFVPRQEQWREQRGPDPTAWIEAGAIGMLLPDVPEEYGGGGGTFAHQAVVLEELAYAGVHFGCSIQGVVAHYILAYGSDRQRRQWLPRLARGELIAAIAMSEPGAGSDLQAITTTARREGDRYLINGSKTFVTNGRHASLVCLAVKTDSKAPGWKGISLIVVEPKNLVGYRVGRPLEKIGMHAQDTCEIYFNDMPVPADSLLGLDEGKGFSQMMEQLPYERLAVGVSAVAASELAVSITTDYVRERTVFGKSLLDFQNTRFKLAECKTESHIARVFLDSCIERYMAGMLDEVTSAMAKYWLTECQFRIVDECVQLHGGYGYLTEYEIARMWADSRVQRIYAGSNEIMKEIVSWSL